MIKTIEIRPEQAIQLIQLKNEMNQCRERYNLVLAFAVVGEVNNPLAKIQSILPEGKIEVMIPDETDPDKKKVVDSSSSGEI